jgi:hypothetical protein
MARPKKVESSERQTVTIRYRVVPYFAVASDELPGIRGIGATAKEALANMRSEVRRRYPVSQYDLEEKSSDIGLFAATSWKEPVYG